MGNPILIGLNGKKGSGKNTVGEFIRDWAEGYGNKAQLQGFADRLKLSFARIFVPDATLEEAIAFADVIKEVGGISIDTIFPDKELFDRFGVAKFTSGREALQHYGTECHREVFGSDFWVDQLLPQVLAPDHALHPSWVDKWDDGVDYAIITDVRFPNEAERVQELGGTVFEIIRPELEDQQAQDTHASEKCLPRELVDHVLINDADSLSRLSEYVDDVMEEFGLVPQKA